MNINAVWKALTDKTVKDTLHGVLAALGDLGVRDEFTYSDAVKALVNRLPKDPKIVKGAILRKAHPKGIAVFLLGLDAKDWPIHGLKVVTRNIDAELEDSFGSTDLILVE